MAGEEIISQCKQALEKKRMELREKLAGCSSLSGLRGFEDGSGYNIAQVKSNNREMDLKLLREVEDALESIAVGTFNGRCRKCGQWMWDRLSACPEAKYCIVCKNEETRKNQNCLIQSRAVARSSVHSVAHLSLSG